MSTLPQFHYQSYLRDTQQTSRMPWLHLTRWYCETQPVCRWMLMFTDDHILCLLILNVLVTSVFVKLTKLCVDTLAKTQLVFVRVEPSAAAAG